MKRLDGKVALITGAGSGIGKASAELFASEGAKVVAFDQTEGVRDVVRGIVDAGGMAQAMVADAGSDADVAAAVKTAIDSYGSLDVVFANAGVSGGLAGLFDLAVEDWERILRVNLIGPFLAVKHGAEALRQQGRGGSIICTASVAALRSGAGGTPYAASKAGVVSLVQTACQQLAGAGIRVNAICPGLIETGMTKPMFERARDRGTEAKLGQLNPLRRAGAPIEIARTALFLASDDASYVNGQAYVVDGGLSSSHPVARPGALS